MNRPAGPAGLRAGQPSGPPLSVLMEQPWWAPAIAELARLNNFRGQEAAENASQFGDTYRDRVPAMVVDVVTSRQRRYSTRVVRLVERFTEEGGHAVVSLEALARHGSRLSGLRQGEDQTIRDVATGLLAAGRAVSAPSDRVALNYWCDITEGLEIAHDLDPYVGSVKGIGMALFSYLRMRAGADSIKVDVRVKRALKSLGFRLPNSDTAVFLVARLAAQELGVSLIALDQLLWFHAQEGSIST